MIPSLPVQPVWHWTGCVRQYSVAGLTVLAGARNDYLGHFSEASHEYIF
jgi:hypothetical protein